MIFLFTKKYYDSGQDKIYYKGDVADVIDNTIRDTNSCIFIFDINSEYGKEYGKLIEDENCELERLKLYQDDIIMDFTFDDLIGKILGMNVVEIPFNNTTFKTLLGIDKEEEKCYVLKQKSENIT